MPPIQQLPYRQALKSTTQRPAPLSAQEHAAHRKQLQGIHFIKPKYSDEYEINLAGIFRKWKRYGTSKVYIHQFQKLYTTITSQFIDRNDSREVYKPIVSAAELQVILIFNIAYNTHIFPYKQQRAHLWACYLLLVYTGARPAELVNSEKKKPKDGSAKQLFNRKAGILSNDSDEDDELPPDEVSQKLDNLLLQETEGRGRPKALYYEDILMMMVPRTIFFFTPTKMLLLYPISIIIALTLTTAAHILQTRNQGGAANSANDQMMRHNPKFTTFHSAYLNERVKFDIQNTFLREQTEDQLCKLFAHISLTRDPRATRGIVPQDMWANQQPDPEIIKLEQRHIALKGGTYQVQGQQEEEQLQQLTDTIRLKRIKRNRQTVKDYRKYYFHNRPTWDIKQQARGEPDEEYIEPAIKLNIPKHAKLADLIYKQPADFTQDEMLQRRIQAINLIIALCSKRETSKRRHIRPRVTETPIKNESPRPEIESYPTDPFPLLLDVRQCPNCFRDERLTFEEHTFRYYRPRIRDDHLDNHHLPERERAFQTLKPKDLDHFRNHVTSVYGVPLRCSKQVKQRRLKKAKRLQMAKAKTSYI
ncbi:FluG domain-containing protein [Dactylonectria estremocensis]|uniref:FluG domain-containing protein n=1 Tax=Dactylonectria estremocensis TaxID=1079267 RepID=A0A9P9DN52_9HYPO|nr:FluG domain-containing protein [Dactylonectria estremocensis]